MCFNTYMDDTTKQTVEVTTRRNYLPTLGPVAGRMFEDRLRYELETLASDKAGQAVRLVAIVAARHISPVSDIAVLTLEVEALDTAWDRGEPSGDLSLRPSKELREYQRAFARRAR